MRIRTRLNLTIIGLIGVAVLGFAYLMADEIQPRYFEAQEEVLVDFAETMATLVSQTGVKVSRKGEVTIVPESLRQISKGLAQRPLNAKIYSLDKTKVDTRIYVTDKQGIVIFDSDDNRDLWSDYSKWRDVSRTLKGEYGARTSAFDPLYPEGSTMYVARPIMYAGDVIGVLSVGKPTKNLNQFVTNLSSGLWVTGTFIAVLFALIGYLTYRALTQPLASIQRYALDVSKGIATPRPDVGNNEIGDVEAALQQMRKSLDGKQYIEGYIQSLTHELKAPLAGIQGAAELLREDLPPEKRDLFLKNIHEQSTRLHDLIERLLVLAKLENTDSLQTTGPVRVEHLFEQAVQLHADFARKHRVSLKHLATDCEVIGDSFLLYQALANLVKNAIEHADPNTLVTMHCEQREGLCHIVVTNQGEPIPNYALDKVFDRFYSLPNRKGQKGSGIGLSFVQEVAKRHKGSARLENASGGHVVATISVPASA